LGTDVQRKIFRIEQMHSAAHAVRPGPGADDAELRHHELLNEIQSLRALTERHDATGDADVAKLRQELNLIHEAISHTKHELSALAGGHEGPRVSRAADELDAIAGGTEKATQNILKAAEDIDESAKTLAAAVKNEHEQGLAQDIQDHVISIYEACNFQDLAGQRIAKVMGTLKFIEDHVVRMLDIWAAIDQGKRLEPPARQRHHKNSLLNGPKLDGDDGHASQRDIDTMFN
jgi:chemotaxis protein CheZ